MSEFIIILAAVSGWILFLWSRIEVISLKSQLNSMRTRIQELEYDQRLFSTRLERLRNDLKNNQDE